MFEQTQKAKFGRSLAVLVDETVLTVVLFLTQVSNIEVKGDRFAHYLYLAYGNNSSRGQLHCR
jgi:hypothetical protein